MIEKALPESSAMEKTSLESWTLRKIMPESAAMEPMSESPSMEKAIPGDPAMGKTMSQGLFLEFARRLLGNCRCLRCCVDSHVRYLRAFQRGWAYTARP